jgi:hypothetical protein
VPKSSADLAAEIDRSLAKLLLTFQRVDGLHSSGVLGSRQVDDVVGGLAVLAHAEIEGFLDRLFIGLLSGSVTAGRSSAVVAVMKARSSSHARTVLVAGRHSAFPVWLPYRKTREQADMFFRGGRPFSLLSDSAAQALFQLHIVRNALAHSSAESRQSFQKHCIGDRSLPSWQRRPAGYLRGSHTGGLTRLEYLVSECQVGLVAMAS